MDNYKTKIADYFRRKPDPIKNAKGSLIWNKKGQRLIDFMSGWNIANLGWNNREITDAVIKQAKKNIFIPPWMIEPVQHRYAEMLTDELPKGLNLILRGTGGTEANEMAMKIARVITGRKTLLGCYNTFHGQSMGTLAIGYRKSMVDSISPLVGKFQHISFPDKSKYPDQTDNKILQDFKTKLEEKLSSRDVAAFITEAGIVTGWGDVSIAPYGYLKIVREITKKYGTLLILDEVGTGFSRLGKLFGMNLEKVTPDIATFAKAMTNGAIPMGTTVVREELMKDSIKIIQKSIIGSTFGWTPIACAAALKTLEIHKRDKIWLKSDADGKYIQKYLKNELKNVETVKDIKGIGMEIGLQYFKPQKKSKEEKSVVEYISDECYRRGLLAFSNLSNTILIMPPLNIERSILNKGLSILVSVIKDFSK